MLKQKLVVGSTHTMGLTSTNDIDYQVKELQKKGWIIDQISCGGQQSMVLMCKNIEDKNVVESSYPISKEMLKQIDDLHGLEVK